MKRLVMTALLSLVLWTGATVTAQAGNAAPATKQATAEVADSDTLDGMTGSEAYRLRMAELQLERDRTFYTTEADAEDILDAIVPVLGITVPFLFAFLIIFFFRWVLSIPFFISCIRQQNPLTVLSKIILRKVKQFNLPPPKKNEGFLHF